MLGRTKQKKSLRSRCLLHRGESNAFQFHPARILRRRSTANHFDGLILLNQGAYIGSRCFTESETLFGSMHAQLYCPVSDESSALRCSFSIWSRDV